MPPLSRIHTPILDKLARDLRFAPREALLRDVTRVEELAADIDPAGTYPEDFVIFRVTGFRPDAGPNADSSAPSLLKGDVLLSDLSALAERMCDAASLRVDEIPTDSFQTMAMLGEIWSVSRKTLDRWRREGLIARRVLAASQRPTLVVMKPVAERFASSRADTIKKAGSFSRIPPEIEARMLRRARVYRARFGCSLNQAAQRLARRYDRSPEAIRQLLKRQDIRERPAAGPDAPTADRGSITQRERRLYYRVWLRGLDPVWIARRTRRAPAGVRRAINIERASALRQLAESGVLEAPMSPTFSRKEAAEVLLTAEPVRAGIGKPGVTDLAEFLTEARKRTIPIGAEELARRVGMCFLFHRARAEILGLDRGNPSAVSIDRVETDLRWALRLKAELMRSQWALAIETVESQIGSGPGRGLGALATDLLPELLTNIRDALAEAVDHYEPFRAADVGARLAGSVTVAASRIGARWTKRLASADARGARAQTRILPGVRIPDWTRHVAPWQPLVEPSERSFARLSTLDPPMRRLIEHRLGLNGNVPRTLTELSSMLAASPTRLARDERTALRILRGLKPRP